MLEITQSTLLKYYISGKGITIRGHATRSCSGNPVATCNNIGDSLCCVFPTRDLIAQADFFTILYDCTIGNLYYESPGNPTQRGIVRNNKARGAKNVCLSSGNDTPGGGAAWIGVIKCLGRKGLEERSQDLEEAASETQSSECKSKAIPVIYGWPKNDTGVYVLKPTEEQYLEYNLLPATESEDEYVANLKLFNATYFTDASLSLDASTATAVAL
ncbi:hypothetical protein BDZ45DRAFT_757768 [Acephala macrosclerotiorum]|nr:hypothetical protein BDZ45DRAFT_757768 [Acephala macrosclerotiorum]